MSKTGASDETARAYGLTEGGDEASKKMARDDLDDMRRYKTIIGKVARKQVTPALIAAIISRESQAGKSISGTNGWGDEGNGFGLMQVDKRYHKSLRGAWNSVDHLDQATGILVDIIAEVQRDFPGWSRENQLKGALAYYNMGREVFKYADVDWKTTGHDYSSDVLVRAQFYRENGF